MCYIYKFWWNSVSKYIGLYLAITSYSTRFNISHSLLSHDHYIKQNIRHKLTSGLYCKWYVQERTSGSMEARWTPHIHSLMVMPISLTVCQWNKLQNKQAYIFFLREISTRKGNVLVYWWKTVYQRLFPETFAAEGERKAFLGHLKKRNIYTFYKVSTDRFHTRGQQLFFFFLEQKRVLQKKRVQSPRDFFWYTNMATVSSLLCTQIWPLWDLCENDPYSNHCLQNVLWVEGWIIHLYSTLASVDNDRTISVQK